MKLFQDECMSIEQYAQKIGKSRRTVQRYISMGMPIVNGTHKSIHLPTTNEWWRSQISSTNDVEATNDG